MESVASGGRPRGSERRGEGEQRRGDPAGRGRLQQREPLRSLCGPGRRAGPGHQLGSFSASSLPQPRAPRRPPPRDEQAGLHLRVCF